MSTTLHETPTRPSSPRPPRRRPVALVVTGAVLVAAIGAGAALALGGRSDQPAAAVQPAADQATKVATPASGGTATGQEGSGQGQLFYYTLHMQGGAVQQIDEHQAQPAC
jgi:hypothetical protein